MTVTLALMAGCAAIGMHAEDSPAADAAPASAEVASVAATDLATAMGGHDPLEGFNRVVYHGANTFTRWIYRPVGTVYSSIMPRWGVQRFVYFTDNVAFIPRMGSCFLQGRGEDGGIELLRFLTNTTVGVAGFFEVAEDWRLPRQDEDFGQAFASWGIGQGFSLYGLTPTNLRDAFGSIFDYALDPKTYIYGGQGFTLLNRGLDTYPLYERTWRESFDPYWTFREYQLIHRRLQVVDWSPAQADPGAEAATVTADGDVRIQANGLDLWRLGGTAWQGAVVDTLRVGLFKVQRERESMWTSLSPYNTDFEQAAQVRFVRAAPRAEGRPRMAYRFWAQKDPAAPLVVFLPGLGSHCTGGTGAAFAELAHDRGAAVAVLSNAMNWDFAESAGIEAVPGYTPDDARAVRRALGKVLADLRENRGLMPRSIAVAGASLGGLHTLFLADLERREPTLGIHRYLAVNPPVDPLHGMRTLDRFFAAGTAWREDEAVARASETAGRYLAMLRTTSGAETLSVPIGAENARFIIGWSFRRSLRDLLASLHHRQGLPSIGTRYAWGDRQSLYHELGQYGYEWYIRRVVIPHYRQRWADPSVTLDSLNGKAGLRAIEATLRGHGGIRVIHTGDDFLVTDADRAFLQDALGKDIVFFENGAHLGNLHLPTVQRLMMRAVDLPDAASVPPAVADSQ